MQTATNLIKMGCKIRKLLQSENKKSDLLYNKPMEADILNI